jgi:hypothetical protein
MGIFEFSPVHSSEQGRIDVTPNYIEELMKEFLNQSFPRHECKNLMLIAVGKAYAQSFSPMIHLCLESECGITEVLVTEPADFIPKAVLEVLSKGAQAACFRVGPQNVSDEGNDVMAVSAGARPKATTGGSGQNFGFRME